MSQARHASGNPQGGRFAATSHAEPAVTLGAAASGRDLLGPGTLKKRHSAWTQAAITRFLGEPDKLITNPVVRSQGKMRMYLASRVAEVEASDAWQAWVASYERRSARFEPTSAREARAAVGRGRTGTYPVAF